MKSLSVLPFAPTLPLLPAPAAPGLGRAEGKSK